MTQGRVWAGLLLPVLMMGCARDRDLQAMQAAMVAFEWQNNTSHQTVEARVQQVSDRLTELEHTQAETRQAVAQMATTLDGLRLQLQRIQGAVQKTKHQVHRGARKSARDAAVRVANIERRLRALTTRLHMSSP